MDLSRLRTRRGIVAALAAVAFSSLLPEGVKAQLNAGCEYGMTNGLVTIGGDNCGLAVPQHMVDAKSNADGDDGALGTAGSTTQSPQELRQERLLRHRDHVRTKRGRRTEQKQLQQGRHQERKIVCEDFSNQLQAVEAMSHSPSEAWRLDPDGDGIPCERLTPLTCRSLGTEAQATNWFNKMGYTPVNDPFKLYDAETGGVCSERKTCDDFSTQKQAVEWLTDHPKDKNRLDPDGNFAPCANLPTVTCGAFSNQKEAINWFNHNNFTQRRDPYGLHNAQTGSICPVTTCANFRDQKAAVEWIGQYPGDKARLDPDNDGRPCMNLKPVTCSQLTTEEGSAENITAWFNLYFSPARDPYKLYNTNKSKVCPSTA
jgi:hypothetical protein